MKNLIFIGGAMGVGKTSVAKELKKLLPENVFLEGDNCWDSTPFVCNEHTKKMVQDNIVTLLNSFLSCPDFSNVIFAWVLHKQEICDNIVFRLLGEFTFYHFTLTAEIPELVRRNQADVDKNLRDDGVIQRAKERQSHAQTLNTYQIDTTKLTPFQVAQRILEIINPSPKKR